MANGTVTKIVTCDGETLPPGTAASYTATGSGVEKHEIGGTNPVAFPAGFSGSSTEDSSGSALITGLATGHGLTTNSKVGVFWAGGRRVGMTVSAATSTTITVTASTGIGATYPSPTTAVVVSPAVSLDVSFDGDSATMLVVYCDQISAVDFRDDTDTSLVNTDISDGIIAITTANVPYAWTDTMPDPQPITGDPVAVAKCYNGSTTAANMKIKAILDT